MRWYIYRVQEFDGVLKAGSWKSRRLGLKNHWGPTARRGVETDHHRNPNINIEIIRYGTPINFYF